jgi:hypothetical protein
MLPARVFAALNPDIDHDERLMRGPCSKIPFCEQGRLVVVQAH